MKRLVMFFVIACFPLQLFATTYSLPAESDALIGQIQYNTAQTGDTLVTIAKRYDIGYNAIENANSHLDLNKSFPSGTSLQIPTKHLLPNQPRKGIVINLPEMRMYYFLADRNEILTYPIGIGKIDKTIPIKKATIVGKKVNPTWTPPQDIIDFNLEKGIVLPKVMPAGPDNPLGPYAIYTSLSTYLIHSTIFPESIGTRASFGCIRMYEDDIKEFFPSIEKNIPVVIINSPAKAGWENQQLYLEIHPPLEEHNKAIDASLPGVVSLIADMTKDREAIIDWQAVSYISKEKDGIPHDIGIDLSSLK
jgi:L,D-transpeptidase ErfK/SrfK